VQPFGNPLTMYTYQPGMGAIRRNPLGGLRAPHGASNPRQQRLQARVLLADCCRRCHQDRAALSGMPVLCKTDAYASTCPIDDSNNLGLHGVGFRPCRTSTEGILGL
jgi:hypothetical protein